MHYSPVETNNNTTGLEIFRFYGTRRIVIVVRISSHWYSTWASSILPTPSHHASFSWFSLLCSRMASG